jgi:hypothetical protein
VEEWERVDDLEFAADEDTCMGEGVPVTLLVGYLTRW